jgi:hypothetical protein
VEVAFSAFLTYFGRDIFNEIQALLEPVMFLDISRLGPTLAKIANHGLPSLFHSINCNDS